MNAADSYVSKWSITNVGLCLATTAICGFIGLIQTLLGATVEVSALFSGALLFAMLAVYAAGGASAMGLLNLILVGRFLFGAYFAKNVLMGESIAARMQAPDSTALVMLLGFFSVFVGTLVGARYIRALPVFRQELQPRQLLILTMVLFFGGHGASVGLRLTGITGGELTGGVWGIVKSMTPFANVAVPVFMLYLWRTSAQRYLTNPVLLLLITACTAIGILQTGKQAMAEPLVFYVLMAFARYGWRYPAIWMLLVAGLAGFQSFVFPVSQYIRNAGGRDLDAASAFRTTADTVWGFVTDSTFRKFVEETAKETVVSKEGLSYLDPQYAAFSRMALVADADRLIAATDQYKDFTGWDTIRDAALLSVPSFIYPNKPQLGTNNFLGRYAGDLANGDFETQVSYGFFANWYNAFSLTGVAIGSLATVLWIFLLVGLVAMRPVTQDPWSLLTVLGMNQSYVESSMSGQIAALHMPILAILIALAVRYIDRLWLSAVQDKHQAPQNPTSESLPAAGG